MVSYFGKNVYQDLPVGAQCLRLENLSIFIIFSLCSSSTFGQFSLTVERANVIFFDPINLKIIKFLLTTRLNKQTDKNKF